MGQKRLREDSVGLEDTSPAINGSTARTEVSPPLGSSATPSKRARTDPPKGAGDDIAVRVQRHLDRIIREAFIPSHPWDFDDLDDYFSRLQKIQAEFMYAMFALKEESRSVRKPFQMAYSLAILPLRVEHERWSRVDRFYEIHLNRARCAYIRHIWKSSIPDDSRNRGGFIKDIVEYLPAVESLLLVPDDVGVTEAYRLIFYLAGYVYVKSSSISQNSEKEEYYALIDAMLLRVIERRLRADEDHCDEPSWVSEGLAKFSRASGRFRQHGVTDFLQKSVSRLKEAADSGGLYSCDRVIKLDSPG